MGRREARKYLEKWLTLEFKIKDSREIISQMFLAAYFLERSDIEGITMQLTSTIVNVEEKKEILIQVKVF